MPKHKHQWIHVGTVKDVKIFRCRDPACGKEMKVKPKMLVTCEKDSVVFMDNDPVTCPFCGGKTERKKHWLIPK